MTYTLVSMLGTGMYKSTDNYEGYVETDYYLEDGKHKQTRLFMQALLECKYKDINQIIILGTDTSSWDCLVDKDKDERDETIALWSDLFDQCEQKQDGTQPAGVTRENLDRLEKYLTERFSVEVYIREHTHKVDNNTAAKLFECYSGITKLCKKRNNILFDITHGFRSMPVLLYQSLQYSLSQQTNQNVEIVYGELDLNNKEKGYVRNLSDYWKYSELTNALNIFNEKLDGFKLSELISPYWSKGSKAITALSEIVQTNFALQVTEVIKQIKNALTAYPQKAPEWLLPVKASLEKIAKLEAPSVSATLYNYSLFLNEHKLNVQAVITLQVTVEAIIVEKFASPEQYGDYDWWKNTGREKLNQFKFPKDKDTKKWHSDEWNNVGKPLSNLEAFRNQIAHGGGKNKEGNYPHAANIPAIYESGKRGVDNLFKLLK